MAEALAAIGVIASIVQLIDVTQKMIRAADEIREKSSRVKNTVQAINTECATLQSALISIKAWALSNRDRPEVSPQLDSLQEAVNILLTAMETLLTDLLRINYSFRARLSFSWNNERPKLLLEEIRWQAHALHLLLSALQLPAARSRKRIVDLSHSASLRYGARQDPGVANSIVSDREFDFDDELVDSRAYRKAIATATTVASSPKPAPEYKVFLVPSDFCCDNQASEARCMSVENLDIMASGGWKDIRDHCPTKASSIEGLGSRITEVLCSRPNESGETRWRLYIYCAPCRWPTEIALSIAFGIAGFKGFIRVDDRLMHACHSLLHTVPSMRNMEDMLTTLEHEWRIEENDTRSGLSSSFDLSWLQRRNLLLESATETEDLTLQMYLDKADRTSEWRLSSY